MSGLAVGVRKSRRRLSGVLKLLLLTTTPTTTISTITTAQMDCSNEYEEEKQNRKIQLKKILGIECWKKNKTLSIAVICFVFFPVCLTTAVLSH